MKERMENQDLEWINAYLDQELEGSDLLVFADHLSQDPELKNDMADMLKVKTLLKKLPQSQPPRNYALTRSMAREVRKPGLLERLLPTFRVSVVFCTLALVCTFLLPGLFQPSQQNSLVSKSVSMDELMDMVPTEEGTELAAENVMDTSETDDFTDNQIRVPQSEIVKPAMNMPSFGVRGGTPKNEYLMTAERTLPEEKKLDQVPEIDVQNFNNEKADSSEAEPQFFSAPQAQNTVERSVVVRLLIQIGLGFILLVSLVWVIAARQKSRFKAH